MIASLPGPLLEEHKNNRKRGTVEHLFARPRCLELSAKRHLLMTVEILNNLVKLLSDDRIVDGSSPNMSKCLRGVFDPVLLYEPSRTLVLGNDTQEE